ARSGRDITLLSENERVGLALARGEGWVDAFGPGTGPTAHVAPVYPLVLAGVYRSFGPPATPAGRAAPPALALGLATAVVLLLPVLAWRLRLPIGVGWAAAFLCVALPFHRSIEFEGGHEQLLATLALLGLVWALADSRLPYSDWRANIPLALFLG